jgi:hypothetical protein
VSQNEPALDIVAVLRELESALRAGCTAGKLNELITLLDDATFLPELQRVMKTMHNQPAGLYEIPNAIKRCMRIAERRRDKNDTHARIIQATAIGGGSALIVGGIVATLNPVVGLLALVPVVGGMATLGVSCLGVSRVDDEKSGYKQLAERLAEIHKAIQ